MYKFILRESVLEKVYIQMEKISSWSFINLSVGFFEICLGVS